MMATCPGRHAGPFAILVLISAVTMLRALDGPADLLSIAREQERWLHAVGGLHVTYAIRERATCKLSEAMKPPPELFWQSETESWYDRGLAGYRHEARLDLDGFAAAVREAAKREPRLSPKRFSSYRSSSLLVVTTTGSAYLEKENGRLRLRRLSTAEDAPGLESGFGIQPLLMPMWIHTFTAEGPMCGTQFVHPFVKPAALDGVRVQIDKAYAPAPRQWEVQAHLTFTACPDQAPAPVTIRLGRLGPADGPQFWFPTSLQMEGRSTQVRWREIPGAPFVAIPESYIESSAGVLFEEHRLLKADLPSDLPLSLWSIDPLLATEIVDETAGMAVDAAP